MAGWSVISLTIYAGEGLELGEWKCVGACSGPPARVTCVEVIMHISQYIRGNQRLDIDRNLIQN
jgi:hypothetical protein